MLAYLDVAFSLFGAKNNTATGNPTLSVLGVTHQ